MWTSGLCSASCSDKPSWRRTGSLYKDMAVPHERTPAQERLRPRIIRDRYEVLFVHGCVAPSPSTGPLAPLAQNMTSAQR